MFPLVMRETPSGGGAPLNARGQRGGGRLKAIIWLLILVSFGYTCFKVVPVLFANYEFTDTVLSTAQLAAVNRQTDDQIKDSLVKAAADDGLPVTTEEIQVSHRGYNVDIVVDYSVTVDLRVYQWTFHFHPTAGSTAI
jgi:hypothetical protein